MKAFRISGRFRMGRDWQPFSKELAAADEAAAREKLLSILGSQHGVPRKYVSIAGVEEVAKDQVKDHAVKYALEAGARAPDPVSGGGQGGGGPRPGRGELVPCRGIEGRRPGVRLHWLGPARLR